MNELEDLHTDKNICFYYYWSWERGLRSRKTSLSLPLPRPTSSNSVLTVPMRTFIVVLFVNCYVAFHFFFSFNNYVSWLYIQVSLGNIITTFLGKGYQLCLPSVHFVATLLYLSVIPFDVGGLMWIWLYQFPSSLIHFDATHSISCTL